MILVPAKPIIYKSPLARNPNDLPECPIFDLLLKRIKDRGLDKTEKLWMLDTATGSRVYFKEIETGSQRIASALTRLGFKHADFLYFVTYEVAVVYLIHLGVWRLGGGVRGAFQAETPEEYARQLRETRARFILVDKETFPTLKKAIQLLTWKVKLISFDDIGEADVTLVTSLLEDDGSVHPRVQAARLVERCHIEVVIDGWEVLTDCRSITFEQEVQNPKIAGLGFYDKHPHKILEPKVLPI